MEKVVYLDTSLLSTLNDKKNITMEELAQAVCILLDKCVIDNIGSVRTNNFKIKDSITDDTIYVDMIMRKNATISVTFEQNDYTDEKDSKSSDDEEHSDHTNNKSDVVANCLWGDIEDDEMDLYYEDECNESLDDDSISDTSDDSTDTEHHQEEEDEQNEDEDQLSLKWTEVVSKRKTRRKDRDNEDLSHGNTDGETYYFFSDEYNSNYLDFRCVMTNLNDVCEAAKGHPWAHAYCPDKMRIYSFKNPYKRGVYQEIAPNTSYLKKFSKWFKKYKNFEDNREFILFQKPSNELTEFDKIVKTIVGLKNVRRFIKNEFVNLSHVVCLDTEEVYDFECSHLFKQRYNTLDNLGEDYRNSLNVVLSKQNYKKFL